MLARPSIERKWGGFITTSFWPVFLPAGFIALFATFLKLAKKTPGHGFLGSFWSRVFLPFCPNSTNQTGGNKTSGQKNQPKTSVMKPLFPVPGFWVVLFPGFFFT